MAKVRRENGNIITDDWEIADPQGDEVGAALDTLKNMSLYDPFNHLTTVDDFIGAYFYLTTHPDEAEVLEVLKTVRGLVIPEADSAGEETCCESLIADLRKNIDTDECQCDGSCKLDEHPDELCMFKAESPEEPLVLYAWPENVSFAGVEGEDKVGIYVPGRVDPFYTVSSLEEVGSNLSVMRSHNAKVLNKRESLSMSIDPDMFKDIPYGEKPK